MKKQTQIKLIFGRNAQHTYFGLKGGSHGMFKNDGFDYYVYGIRGIIAFEITKSWGCFIDE